MRSGYSIFSHFRHCSSAKIGHFDGISKRDSIYLYGISKFTPLLEVVVFVELVRTLSSTNSFRPSYLPFPVTCPVCPSQCQGQHFLSHHFVYLRIQFLTRAHAGRLFILLVLPFIAKAFREKNAYLWKKIGSCIP